MMHERRRWLLRFFLPTIIGACPSAAWAQPAGGAAASCNDIVSNARLVLTDESGDTEASRERLTTSANRLFSLVVTANERRKANLPDELCEDIGTLAERAALSFERAGLMAKAIVASRSILLDAVPASREQKKSALLRVIDSYRRIAVYDSTADYDEQLAEQYPGDPHAPSALYEAAQLRGSLCQEERAESDVDRFIESYGAAKPADAAELALDELEHHARREDYAKFEKTFAKRIAFIDKNAPLDVRMQVRVLRARMAHEQARLKPKNADLVRKVNRSAAADYEMVRTIFEKSPESTNRASIGTAKHVSSERRATRTANALAEAKFFYAASARQPDLPRYESEAVGTTAERLEKDVSRWQAKLTSRAEALESRYAPILAIPHVSPEWKLRVTQQIGQFWDDSLAMVDTATSFARHENAPALTARLEVLKSVFLERTQSHMRKCVEIAQSNQIADPFTEPCFYWLQANDKTQYLFVHLLLDDATDVGQSLAVGPPPASALGDLLYLSPKTRTR